MTFKNHEIRSRGFILLRSVIARRDAGAEGGLQASRAQVHDKGQRRVALGKGNYKGQALKGRLTMLP